MKAINTYVYDIVQSDSIMIDFDRIVEDVVNDLECAEGTDPSTEDIITMFGDNMEEYIIASTGKRNFCGDVNEYVLECIYDDFVKYLENE